MKKLYLIHMYTLFRRILRVLGATLGLDGLLGGFCCFADLVQYELGAVLQ